MKKKLLIIIPLCLALTCAAWAGAFVYGRTAELEGMRGGVHEGLPYRIYVPETDGGAALPLLLYLHGAGARQGRGNRAQIKENSFIQMILSEENLREYPCIVLAPQCPKNQRWVQGPDDQPNNSAALMALLEYIAAEYPVDKARVYITGVSMGGFGTWGMLRAYPDYFAAAVPICGGWDLDDDIAAAPVMKDVPIWAFHGDGDDLVPVERTRGMVEALEAVGGNIRYTEYPGEGHGISGLVYGEPELLPWMFSQAKLAGD